jgi:hypothetical protein
MASLGVWADRTTECGPGQPFRRYLVGQMRQACAVAAIAVSVFLSSGLASAGLPGVELEGSKSADGTFKDLTRARVKDSRDLFVQASNVSGEAYDATMTDDVLGPGDSDYRIRWFKGDKDITDKVRGPGYDFSVANNDEKRFRVRVKVRADNPKRICFRPLMQGPAFGGNEAFFAINRRSACDAG